MVSLMEQQSHHLRGSSDRRIKAIRSQKEETADPDCRKKVVTFATTTKCHPRCKSFNTYCH
jgi:hypothetical protein